VRIAIILRPSESNKGSILEGGKKQNYGGTLRKQARKRSIDVGSGLGFGLREAEKEARPKFVGMACGADQTEIDEDAEAELWDVSSD
jgi:hypothetical protein